MTSSALLMNGKRAVTVAGAHGKTTTSSMLSHILVNAGADPSYAIGGFIRGPDGTTLDGGHAGKGDILVAEAENWTALRQIPSDHRHYHQL